jgi:mRNA interferase MazF
VVIAQGDVCWADLGEPSGSGPGYRRPVVVVQSDDFNRSAIRTVVCVPLTSNRKWSASPGNVALSERDTGLPRSSVANVTQLVTLDRQMLSEAIGQLAPAKLQLVLSGIDVVLGRS